MKLMIALLIEMTSLNVIAATPRIGLDELRALQLNKAPIELVDVRMSVDFAKGHIQGARNVPQGEVGTGVWDRTGLGTQHELPVSVNTLLKRKFLEHLNP